MTTKTDIQIRFGDIDALGHVNNVNLQHYFDLGKSDYFRQVFGVGGPVCRQGSLREPGAAPYPITAATQTSYLAQTRPDERIYVETAVEAVGTKSITFVQRIVSHAGGEVKAESRSVMVAFDFAAQSSVPVPDAWREAVTKK